MNNVLLSPSERACEMNLCIDQNKFAFNNINSAIIVKIEL